MSVWWQKVKALFRRAEIDAELEEELRVHREMQASETGDEPATRRHFGAELLLDDWRDAWRWPHLEGWLRDLRYGVRGILKPPGVSATVIVTLPIGILPTSA